MSTIKNTMLAAAILGALAVPARAGSDTADLQVTATVIPSCVISTQPVAFGAYDPIVANATSPADTAGSVTIACTRGSSQTIELGLGANASGNTRRLSDGSGGTLVYGLFQDNDRGESWGTGLPAVSPSAAPSVDARTFTIFGRIPAGQDIAIGQYADTVVATVNF